MTTQTFSLGVIWKLYLCFDVFMIHPLLAEFNTWFDTCMYIWAFHVYVVLNKQSLSAQANFLVDHDDIYFYCPLFDHPTSKLFSIFTLPSFNLINYFSSLVEYTLDITW